MAGFFLVSPVLHSSVIEKTEINGTHSYRTVICTYRFSPMLNTLQAISLCFSWINPEKQGAGCSKVSVSDGPDKESKHLYWLSSLKLESLMLNENLQHNHMEYKIIFELSDLLIMHLCYKLWCLAHIPLKTSSETSVWICFCAQIRTCLGGLSSSVHVDDSLTSREIVQVQSCIADNGENGSLSFVSTKVHVSVWLMLDNAYLVSVEVDNWCEVFFPKFAFIWW